MLISSGAALAVATGIGIAIMARGVDDQPAEDRDASPVAIQADETSVPPELLEVSRANGRFAVDLYRELLKTEPEQSLFISPFSISTILTMAAEGAVGETLDQITGVLQIPPGQLKEFHDRQNDLERMLSPAVPEQLAARIKSLRSELKEANARTQAFQSEKKWKDAVTAHRKAQKLADQINSLMKRVSAYELQIANSLWMEASYPVEPDFLAMAKARERTGLFPVDFKSRPEAARRQINEWVAEQTNNRIQDLLASGSVDEQSRLVLTNTVYFRGDWARPFQASETRPRAFSTSSGRWVNVPMMHQWAGAGYSAVTGTGELFETPREIRRDLHDDDPSLYPDDAGHTLLALDYQGAKVQMVVVLPRSATGLRPLEDSLTYEKLDRWLTSLDRRAIQVWLPKFKLDSSRELRAALEQLGMQRCFSPREAQLNKLSASRLADDPLFISDVVHQTFVDVSEVGTEAAAATALPAGVSEGGFDEPRTRRSLPSSRPTGRFSS
jgi:serpin B